MQAEMTHELATEFATAWNSGDADLVASWFAEDGEFHASVGSEHLGASYHGRDAVRRGVQAFFDRFPGGVFENLRVQVSGTVGTLEWDFVATGPDVTPTRVAGGDVLEFRGRKVLRKNAFRKVTPPASAAGITRDDALALVTGVVEAFESGSVARIVEGFTDDATVDFGAMDTLRGKQEIEAFFHARFRRQTDYRLTKQLRMVDGDRLAVAWWGYWTDAETGHEMRGKGVETWTIRDGRIAHWEAAFNPVGQDEDPRRALGIL